MTDRGKSNILRPKVRFSQSSSPNSSSPPEVARAFAKPRIRSVVDLKGPTVKILKAPSEDFREKTSETEETYSKLGSGDSPNALSRCPQKSSSAPAPRLTEIALTPESRPLRPKNACGDRETSKAGEARVAVLKPCVNESGLEAKHPSSEGLARFGSSREAGKPRESLSEGDEQSRRVSRGLGSFSQRELDEKRVGKENVAAVAKSKERDSVVAAAQSSRRSRSDYEEKNLTRSCGREASSKAKETLDMVEKEASRRAKEASSKTKEALNRARKDLSTSKDASSRSKKDLSKTKEASSRAKEVLSKTKEENLGRAKEASCKTMEASSSKKAEKIGGDSQHRKVAKEIGLMPCMKAGKIRSKSVPMKKTVVRDISSGRSEVYVGPGVARRGSPLSGTGGRAKSPRSRSDILSGNKLARPEYNSTVNTMKKLQELREERVVRDLEHLPAVYRGLVNGKVSSALDFGANEAIYRDLVDLTIDEKQLPSRLTRSKDPEPRQKDLAPKLSDFFQPTNDEEYRKAVLPRAPSPRVPDIWNPYRISDRIFAWKESLDHDL